ncbi:fatty acid hydroxylase domain-containing protein 2 [Alligator sinensis]|uniref:Fatty acid hydroxylase domain-containing protein 2 n=1 Tax=Alligator sinensis TaxID=38654 RepID=A0A3Q0GBH3_ALLSI|nr:fatty acid hydroxylase domain-containing protein 2 [Alligator sinensis]
MKTSAFIIGTSLLLFGAFSNSAVWARQKSWEPADHFWQTQWQKVYRLFGGNEQAIYFSGTLLVPFLVFWCVNGVYMVADVTGKPNFITRYRIQLGKNDPVDTKKLLQAVRTVLFNLFFISVPLVVLTFPIVKWWGDPCREELPTFRWVLIELLIFGLVEEILFYYSHRLFHHPLLYKHIHKKHHEWTAPVSVVALYSHPVEHLLSNTLPVLFGPILLRSHITSTMLWVCIALAVTSISHCGYHLPFLPSPEFHDFHHLKFNQCYGVVGILDYLHGTDTLFKQSQACKGPDPMPRAGSIPDSPRKAK